MVESNWKVSIGHLSGVVQDNDLSGEVLDSNVLDVLNRHVLDVESNVVSGGGLRERFMMHLHGIQLSAQLAGGESDDHAGLDNSGLNTAHWNFSNAYNFVDILKIGRYKKIGRL